MKKLFKKLFLFLFKTELENINIELSKLREEVEDLKKVNNNELSKLRKGDNIYKIVERNVNRMIEIIVKVESAQNKLYNTKPSGQQIFVLDREENKYKEYNKKVDIININNN
jgi:hypothetical protein